MDPGKSHRRLAGLIVGIQHADRDPVVMVGGRALPLLIRRHNLARRISLRLAPDGEAAVVTLPPGADLAAALAFARSRSDWLAARLTGRPVRVPFHHDAPIPLLGVPHRLCPAPEGQRGVMISQQAILVPGRPEHFARRVRDWLIERARLEATPRARQMADRLGTAISRIRFSDPRSRWGSASARGVLSFSWRLVMAPPMVLDYVVAHEVAHLREMNHGPAFWELVESLTAARRPAQAWLKREGARLHLYG